MGREDGHAILSSTCFQLGITGAQITRSFSLLIQHTGLTHKQVGLLAVVDADQASSQREIAARLGVAPSLVVSLVDQLASIGAVRRTRSRTDRRVQVVEITDDGRQLLRLATDAAKKLDTDLRKRLSPADLQALDRLLPALLQASSVAADNGA
ncbi:MarR family winged helix-turn-helix transcriptional regulator [Actinomyces sp. Marseille-P3109]|uniref:MarR family winged helix-turn-helix transcriptional regulator n=1 Tax=Actinomyces sp. Marseille-P3109 TaxID=2083009 RepID=UPI000D552BD6|nr:MarR family winged helix-turn-helix transcriptional regulator [Actinomyces sp. Marseille-P3109]